MGLTSINTAITNSYITYILCRLGRTIGSMLTGLEGLTCRDVGAAQKKLGEFSRMNTHIVADFDGTLIARDYRHATSWGAMRALLPEAGKQEEDDLYDYYHPLELAGQGELSESDALDWLHGSLQLYTKYSVNLHHLSDAVAEVGIHEREGARQLFERCGKALLPITIVSAGVGNVIEYIVAPWHSQPTLVCATMLKAAEDGRVVAWEEKNMVHPRNKQDKSRPYLDLLEQKRPYTLLLGDSLEDASTVAGTDRIFRVRVHDSAYASLRTGYSEEQYSQESWQAGYDAIVYDSLTPIVNLIDHLPPGDVH